MSNDAVRAHLNRLLHLLHPVESRLKRRYQSFQPHKDWQTHEFAVAFLTNGPMSIHRGYQLRFYREGFDLGPGGRVGDLQLLILRGLDRAIGLRWAVRYTEIDSAKLGHPDHFLTVGVLEQLELLLRIEQTTQRLTLLSRKVEPIADAFDSYGVHVIRPPVDK